MLSMSPLKDILPDFPPGPLDEYRKRASFDWREMQLAFESEECIRMKHSVWRRIEEEPLFKKSLSEDLTWQEEHHLCFKRFKKFKEFNFLTPEDELFRHDLQFAMAKALSEYDAAMSGKIFLSCSIPQFLVMTYDNQEHLDLIEKLQKAEVVCAFSLTEVAHGSNTQGMRTKATFDPDRQEFVVHTPDFKAAKVWAGNLGQTASYTILFAMLYLPNGQCKGLKTFLVPVRDPKTMIPYPGVTVGDVGPKIGLNGIDNGFMMFNNYRIPKTCFLGSPKVLSTEKSSTDVDTESKSKMSFAALSLGRISITSQACINLKNSVVIAVRYSAVRSQFGPIPDRELPVIEYQLQQWKLFPFVSAAYVIFQLDLTIGRDFVSLFKDLLLSGKKNSENNEKLAYTHALTCCAKAVTTWTAKECAASCREACGGHGYLKAAGIGKIIGENDVSCTYEGANTVILQVTSKYLLSVYGNKMSLQKDPADCLEDLHFVKHFDDIMLKKFPSFSLDDQIPSETIIDSYEWLVCHLMKLSANKYDMEFKRSNNQFFSARNSQAYYCHHLAVAYFHLVAITRFHKFVLGQQNKSLKFVLDKLCRLYGLWTLEKYLSILYSGGYCSGELPDLLVKENILMLCKELKDEAVALVDALAPPDFVLQSVLGRSDGQVYKALEEVFRNTPGAMERPTWWREITDKPVEAKL